MKFAAWLALICAALVAAGGTGMAQSLGDTAATGGSVASAATGEATYREICQACHMANAEGGQGAGVVPALAKNAHLADKDFMLTRVLRGKGGMPAFAGMLTPVQVEGVTNYVRTHFGNDYKDAVTPADVRRLTPEGEGE
jgi:mono/diheme cytochrome c family protein